MNSHGVGEKYFPDEVWSMVKGYADINPPKFWSNKIAKMIDDEIFDQQVARDLPYPNIGYRGDWLDYIRDGTCWKTSTYYHRLAYYYMSILIGASERLEPTNDLFWRRQTNTHNYSGLNYNNYRQTPIHPFGDADLRQKIQLPACIIRNQYPLYQGRTNLTCAFLFCKVFDQPSYNDRFVYMTVKQLKAYCRENKMKGYSKLRRNELQTFIMKYE